MEIKKKKIKINKNINVLCSTANPIPFGLELKRDLTIKEACYCLKNIMGFNIQLSFDEFESKEELNEYKEEITKELNDYLKGKSDWGTLCETTYCYDYDNMGISIACHLYVLSYLIKKGII